MDFLIVGGGLAGAAVAWQLARRGAGSVLIVEREPALGVHSSGRNAAMIRQVVGHSAVAALAREGAAFLREQPESWAPRVPFDQCGSLLTFRERDRARMEALAEEAGAADVEVEVWDPAQCRGAVPVLDGADLDGALWTPSDGVVDVAGLLSRFWDEARRMGAECWLGAGVTSVTRPTDGAWSVATTRGEVRARVLVNAAGAWANALAEMAGVAPLPLEPCRRHLFITPPNARVGPGWPFVWDVSHEVYFRPESGGLLLCPCDVTPMEPGDPLPVPEATESLATKLEYHVPRLAEVSVARGWAGLRVLTPDGAFVIGADSAVPDFFWVAGLGGHGVTTSAAVGRLATDLLTGVASPLAAAHSPGRWKV